MARMTQNERILEYMQEYGKIDPYSALEQIGTMKLSTRISELRKAVHKIADETVHYVNVFNEHKHYKRYWLEEENGRMDKTTSQIA